MAIPDCNYLKAPKYLLATHHKLEHEHRGHLIGIVLVLLPAELIKIQTYNYRIQLYPVGVLR